MKLLEQLDRYEKLKLIDGLESKVYHKGDTIIEEGDEGENFFIIEEGIVECLKTEEVPFHALVHVRDLTTGAHFGELALI